MLIKRKDLYAVAIVLALALLTYFIVAGARAGRHTARAIEVRVNGALYRVIAPGGEQTVSIEQPDGSVNIIRVTEEGFYMEASTCANQLCVKQGMVTMQNYKRRLLGAHILCLPNRVDAYFVLERPGDTEGMPDA